MHKNFGKSIHIILMKKNRNIGNTVGIIFIVCCIISIFLIKNDETENIGKYISYVLLSLISLLLLFIFYSIIRYKIMVNSKEYKELQRKNNEEFLLKLKEKNENYVNIMRKSQHKINSDYYYWNYNENILKQTIKPKKNNENAQDNYVDKDTGEVLRKPISIELKNQIWNRDGGKCVICGSNHFLEFDHIIPVSKGGATSYRNLQLLCQNCNRKKSDNI